ncbi:GNAT family N-acetyltransferase [Azospirillum brasilense]|nr:GNAT family N-acetyltransferase [Azospirillum brasilense]
MTKSRSPSAPLTITVRSALDLSPEELAGWEAILADEPVYASPFFTPGYVRLVAQCVDGVMVGLIWENGALVGVFPYELEGPGKARPVGSVFCDYQAVIARRRVDWTVEGLLAGLGLEQWRFDHLLAVQTPFAPYIQRRDVSWSIDLSQGFAVYDTWLRDGKHRPVAETRRKLRMMERELGPVTFDAHVGDHDLLDGLLARKSAQWARSGWPGRFSTYWEHRLMHRLLDTQTPGFAGMLSVLRAAGRPLAMHIGMRSRAVWHYWTTVYDDGFARYSPGNVMLVEMIKAAPGLGLHEIDLGKEDFEYKRRLHTHVVPVVEGVLSTAAPSRSLVVPAEFGVS